MKLADYNVDDNVQVLINNPRNNNVNEWRDGKVITKRLVYPRKLGYETPKPYIILIVEVVRTYYCKIKDVYNGLVWVGEEYEYKDKLNQEIFTNDNEVKKL